MDRSTLREHDAVLLAEHSWYIFLGSQSGLPGGFVSKDEGEGGQDVSLIFHVFVLLQAH